MQFFKIINQLNIPIINKIKATITNWYKHLKRNVERKHLEIHEQETKNSNRIIDHKFQTSP